MKRIASIALSLAAVVLAAPPAMADQADENHASYTWVIGALPVMSSDTAMAPDGSTITMKGHGTMMAGPGGTASGGGTYAKSSGDHGTFTVTGIDGFVSYGTVSIAILPPGATGGEAKLRVTLHSLLTGMSQSGVLTIVCGLGTPPPSKMEGIQLILGSGVSGEYTKQDGGNTIFIKKP